MTAAGRHLPWQVALRTARPTAAALPWSPLLGVGLALVLGAALVGALSDRPGPLGVLGAGALAAGAVATLRDPADRLLAAVPTSRLARRLLRLALVLGAVVALLAALTALTPGPDDVWASTLALTLTGLAVATWLPADRGVLAAAALPFGWVAVTRLADLTAGPLDWWSERPWLVALLASAAVVAGRHR